MINNISLKRIATFDNEGIKISGLKKVNFIYGTNGSGKTTISNYLYNPDDQHFKNCNLEWSNEKTSTLVYNREFRKRNFGNGKLDGVFTLGEATAEDIKNIESKVIELNDIKLAGQKKRANITLLNEQKSSLSKEFKEFTWLNIYKNYDKLFKDAFVGFLTKEKFKSQLLFEKSNNSSEIKTFEYLKDKSDTIFGSRPQNLIPISNIAFDRLIDIEQNEIWQKVIVGNADVDIAKLIQKLNISDWVNEGKGYLQENEICPFCQEKTITDSFKKQLDSLLNEEYKANLKTIKELKDEYDLLSSNLINELTQKEITQKSTHNSKVDLEKYSAYLKTLHSQILNNIELTKNKVKEPSRIFNLVNTTEQLTLIKELIENADLEINKNNKIVSNYNSERETLIKQVWMFLVNKFDVQITNYNSKAKDHDKGIAGLTVLLNKKLLDFKALDSEIKTLNKNVTSIKPTIDKINLSLTNYGFHNFSIEPAEEDGFYRIQREDGTIAEKTLSEGEVTFITFLYYLQLTTGAINQENVNDQRILIVDDPISSLDSNVLFIVSTLVKEIIKKIKSNVGNIKQLILLTHNVYFHKEVSYEGLHKKGEKSKFWILRKNVNQSIINCYGEKNPIQSSYELLWREIKEWQDNSGITIQNTMRRILENFYSILGNKRDEFLINKFTSSEEKNICRSLLSWANEGSHTLPDDLFVESPDDTIEKYLEVFKNIFYHTKNEGHYLMMMGINEE